MSDLLEIARQTGLRQHLHGISAQDARKLLTEYVTAVTRAQPAPGAWQPIETAPHMKRILITYVNELGKSRVIKARFVPRFTEESHPDDYEGCSEYYEEKDIYTVAEDWYEQVDNWEEYSEVTVNYQPTHWQPLPEPPKGEMQ